MLSYRNTLLAFILFISLFSPIYSLDTAVLSDSPGPIGLKQRIYLFEDKDAGMDIDDARNSAGEFTLSGEREPNLGFTGSAYWVLVKLRNETEHRDWILELAYPPFDSIDMYLVSDLDAGAEILYRTRTGDSVAMPEKDIRTRTHTAELPVPPGGTAYLFLRCRTESSFVLPLRIWKREAFVQHHSRTNLLFGILFGFYLVMALYHIPLYFSSRERSYLYYTLFVSAYLFFQISMSGIGALYLWPARTWWIDRSLILFGSFSIFFTLLFTREFLQTGRRTPVLNKFFIILLIISGFLTAIGLFIPYYIGIQTMNYLMSFVGILFIISAVTTLKAGYAPARYYLIAWISFISAVLIIALKNFGIVPSTPFTSNVLYIGGGLEVVLLSIALGDKINHLTKQHEQAEEERLKLREEMLRAMEEQLYTDSLTGLASRAKLINDLNKLTRPVLFLINIDQFKGINNFYGNKIGDKLIDLLGNRLQSLSIPGHSALYRLHADEFALVIDEELDNDTICSIADEMYHRCQKETYSIHNLTVHIEVSIGIAAERENLLEKADIALSISKSAKSPFSIYDPSMQTMKQYENNLKWIEVIKSAIEKDNIYPVFQPIYRNADLQIDKYETLIRLRREDGTVASPGAFLPIAKAAKLYPALSQIVIDKCFKVLEKNDSVFTVNLSIDDIRNEETLGFIRNKVATHSIRNKLAFEILESEGIGNYEAVSEFIDEMKSYGIEIAIDDFGSGYSNFEYLLKMKIDYLKIDSSLIRNLDRDIHARHVVETIIAISRKLEYKTVAEFVHNREVLDAVRQLNIDFSQGFYLSEPLELH